ncbi:ATP-binding protein [Elizabethkingia anophelis]|uniref:ATP-binding protein n=1 Tax=Elizabethkingia anophelis TaxID=1117645 RepID=UPI00136FFF98|nr:ATP-binding protein [Elizabethkingia anophelis]MYY29523.1 ATP-binding protein [Elizabethkingia anophelis]HAY3506931.1 ATP-binding protein [Elizabethkingia anophelis]
MTKEDKQRVIGKIVTINSDRFTVELLSGLDNFNMNGYDDIHYFAQLNSYVIIPYQNYYIVAEVSGVREKDLNLAFSNPTDQILSKIQTGKFLDVLPIGTIKTNSNNEASFEFGVSVYPSLYSDVLYIKELELDVIFKTDKLKERNCQKTEECNKGNCTCENKHTSLPIGKSIIFPDYEVKIDIDKFFGSHSAVLGNTGSGKSCTISSMLQTLYKFKSYSATGSTFIFFDVNGEYSQAFEKINIDNADIEIKKFTIDDVEEGNADIEKFILPHWFLNIDEWGLLLKASEKSQIPVLRNALGFTQYLDERVLRHIYACSIMYVYENWESSVTKRQKIISLVAKANFDPVVDCSLMDAKFGNFPNNTAEETFKTAIRSFIDEGIEIDPKYVSEKFEFKDLEVALETAILYEEYHGNKQIRDYCSSMITRFKSIKEREDFKFLTRNDTNDSIEIFLRNHLGIDNPVISDEKKSQVIIIDLNSANDETVEIISCVLSRMIFEKLKNSENRNKFPVNLVLEEAHRYISTDLGKVFGDANKIFERIAKEGRKYGMFLLVSSQRPSELSKTVLSQCSNFIVHRIQNPEDLSHIRQITPHISETVLKRLPSIPTQHALIFGHSVNLPTTFKVNDANPKPKSDNNEISNNWFKPKYHKVKF